MAIVFGVVSASFDAPQLGSFIQVKFWLDNAIGTSIGLLEQKCLHQH